MAIDLRDLGRGILTYAEREAALDDIRFDRIRAGFEAHFLVSELGPSRFRFERGEGYPRTSAFDAFALVDSGSVERIRDGSAAEVQLDGNVIPFGPRFGWLRYSLNIRSIMIIWLLMFVFSWLALGGDWLFALVGLVAVWTLTIIAVQRSLRKKVRGWLERQSWN